MENGTYKLDAYTQFKVYEPKERDIVSTRIKDRVFQRSLCDNYFYDTMTKSFIYDNCACQDGRGTEFARKRLICHLQKYYRKHGTEGWVLKADLKNFFGSTSHELAYSAVTKRVNDEWVNGEIKRIIDSFNQGDDPEVGMGLGSETTQLIQLAVLDAVVIAFIANETISIVENAGLMGINIPPAITSAIEVLKKKSDSADNTDQ